MDVKEFTDYLNQHPDEFEWQEGEHEGKAGFLVANKRLHTMTHFTPEAISKQNLEFLLVKTRHGRDVEHITRVTGYFSKVSGWNKGKMGELGDRYRSDVI